MRSAIEFGPVVIEKGTRHQFADHFHGCTKLIVMLVDLSMTSMKSRFIPAGLLALVHLTAPNKVFPYSSRSVWRARRALRDAGYLRPETRDGVRGYTLVRHRDVVKQFQCGGEHLCMLDADYEPVQETETPAA